MFCFCFSFIVVADKAIPKLWTPSKIHEYMKHIQKHVSVLPLNMSWLSYLKNYVGLQIKYDIRVFSKNYEYAPFGFNFSAIFFPLFGF